MNFWMRGMSQTPTRLSFNEYFSVDAVYWVQVMYITRSYHWYRQIFSYLNNVSDDVFKMFFIFYQFLLYKWFVDWLRHHFEEVIKCSSLFCFFFPFLHHRFKHFALTTR